MADKGKRRRNTRERRRRWQEAMQERIHLSMSKPEFTVHTAFMRRGITTEAQRSVGKYFADVYIPRYNLLVLVNGCYWHKCLECGFCKTKADERIRRKDERRVAYFKSKGYLVYVAWEHDIRESPYAVVDCALAVVESHEEGQS